MAKRSPGASESIALIGGHPVLDFVNTIEYRHTIRECDYIPTLRDVLLWSVRSRLLLPRDATNVRITADSAANIWHQLARLRQLLYEILIPIAEDRAVPAGSVAHFNQRAARAAKYAGLRPVNGQLRWSWVGEARDPRRLEWELINGTISLLAERWQLIRVCANTPCDWLFLDTSRNRQRRWCQMQTCGNLSKVRRFRERHD